MTVDPKIVSLEREVGALETNKKTHEGEERALEAGVAREQVEIEKSDTEINRIRERVKIHQIQHDKLEVEVAKQKAGLLEIDRQIANKERAIQAEEAINEAKERTAQSSHH